MIKFDDLFDGANVAKKDKPNEYVRPWTDKYRPSKIADIIHQNDVTNMLNQILATGDMPHLLFHGPPGNGKTSSILALGLELFGPRKFKERVIELNASDERGINVVRNKIMTLAKNSVSEKDPNYLCPPYKIIVLDEADAMTTEAQSALRKIIEDYSNTTRFCLICNYISKIIDPIISRCVKVRFKNIDNATVASRIKYIAKSENIKIDNDAINTLAAISNGDLRKSIGHLQNLKYLNKDVEKEDVLKIANIVPDELMDKILLVCANKESKIKEICDLANFFNLEGYPINTLLSQLVDLVVASELADKHKAMICFHIANTEKRLIDGGDEYLQLLSVFMCIKTVVSNIENIYQEELKN